MSPIVVVFESTHQAMKAETALKEARIAFDIIPTPRDISADCGIAVRAAGPASLEVASVLSRAGLRFRVFKREDRDGR